MSLLLRTLPLRPTRFLSATAISISNATNFFVVPKRTNPLPGTRRTFSSSPVAAASGDVVVKPVPSPPSVLRWVSRTELCGELSVNDVGKRVHLCGWVALHRVHGGLTFLNLRDHTGIVQVRTLPDEFPEAHGLINDMRLEYVVLVEGTVRSRPNESVNKKMKTGFVEVVAEHVEILNPVRTKLPFLVTTADENKDLIKEEIRLRFRCLDLRRQQMKNNIVLRHNVVKLIRRYLEDRHGFIEIETPILSRSTPEGARDYLVPSRIQSGTFYALPQSPQLFKQMLMVSGFDKYYQIARCFRDEDLRADRQPEFTQLDMEMAFMPMEDMLKLNEDLIRKVFSEIKGIQLPDPFPRLTYADAMDRYGSDRPDTRFDLELKDVSNVFTESSFRVFTEALESGGFKLVTPPESSRADKPGATKASDAFQEKKSVSVNYDRGEHEVSVNIGGLRKADIPRRYRIRVENDRFQKDWSVSEVVDRLMALNRWEEVDGVLNSWVGRFARKNFPVLIRELSRRGCIELCVNVFKWMKIQKNYCARNDIYNMMIRLHARHNWVDQARGLFFEMQKWSCKPDAETYDALINAHGRAGQWRWAMNLMDDMLRAAIAPSRSTYNNLINACGSSGNWREALEVCKKMTDNGVGPDLVTHNIVLSAYKSGRQYSKALSYFELMKGAKVRPDTTTFNIIIYCLSKLGQSSQALDLFNSMREKRAECRPDVVTFTSIMHLYSVKGEIENCRAVFEAMVAEGLKPNIVSYNALMGAYAVHGMSGTALSVLGDIKQNGIIPDVVSYTCLLNSYGRSRQPGKAKEVFLMMRKERRKPNVVTYNALIDAYGSNGFLAEAVEIFRQMEQDGIKPNVVSVCTLLAACSRSKKKVNVDTVLSAAQSRGINLNTAAYNSAIGSYINAAELEKAIALYQSMRKKKVKADSVTFTILISGSCRMSKYPEAISYLKEMEDLSIPLTKEVYSSVLCAYSKQGQVTEAESIFNQMKMAGCEPDVIAYTSMLHAYNASEKWGKACELFLEMEANGIEPDSIACSALMRAFNKGGQPSNVFVLMDLMREKEIPFTGAVFFEIFSACNTLQEWKRAIDLIQMMDPYLPSLSIGLTNQMLHLFGKSGKVEAMMKLFYKIIASGVGINLKTYAILLEHLLAVGNWRKYIEVLEWMSGAGIQPSNQMYRDIISFGERSAGIEFEPLIRQKLESLRNKGEGLIPTFRHEGTLL